MQFGRSRRRATVLVLVIVALVAAGNAQADTRAISDGNDRPGPLDIRSAGHAHDGARVVHTISTFRSWRSSVIGRNTSNLFAVEISTDGDPAPERVVLVFSANGRLLAQVIRLPAGTLVGSASASKPNGRTVRLSIPRSRLGNVAGYRWNAHSQYRAAGSCSRFCSDRAPNSGRVLHDIMAPAITLTSFPTIPPDVEYDVSFTVSDKGGAGLDNWELEHRLFGTPGWTTVASGTTAGSKSHHHVAAEDADDEFRVVAGDRQGNSSVSPIRVVSIPIDDTNPLLTYTGLWSQDLAVPQDFRGTLHTSQDWENGSINSIFSGTYVAVVGRGLCGWGYVTIDALPKETWGQLCDDEKRAIVYERTLSAGAHTLLLELGGGLPAIDGILVR
jgi:hypothetical protein